LGADDKWELLHAVALKCNKPTVPNGAHVSVYKEMTIELVVELRQWSVEHVVARSRVNGSAPGDGEDDPVGWEEATRAANSRRSNHPLVLWSFPGNSLPLSDLVSIEGVTHYVPPANQRARLARKWAFVRATYPYEVAPPSDAQIKHAAKIFALMKTATPFPAEVCVNEHFRNKYGWGNPLLGKDANVWLDSAEFRGLVLGRW
jgi:hypothetical protein